MDDANVTNTLKALKEIFSDAYLYMKKWLDPTTMTAAPLRESALEMNDIANKYKDSALADFAAQLTIDCFHTIGRAHGNLAAGRRKEDE